MLKRIIKRFLVFIFANDIDKIAIPNDIKVVSFDVFDTLIRRTVGNPQNIFIDMEERMLSEDSRFKGNFAYIRQAVEKKVRKKSKKQEIKLDEIYDEMRIFLNKDVDDVKKLEIVTEYQNCIPNEKVIELYNMLVEKGMRIILLSDMYLSKELIVSMLNKCGVEGYQHCFVSSDIGLTKREGDLFDYALKKTGYKPNEIIHIGDNPISDFFSPKRMGIRAFLYNYRG